MSDDGTNNDDASDDAPSASTEPDNREPDNHEPDNHEPDNHGPDNQEAERMAARALRRASSSGAKKSRSRAGGNAKPVRRRSSSSSRDPQEVGSIMEEFLAEQGWQATSAIAQVSASWVQIVGPEVAEHVQVESISEGRLHLVADSTAWATQMRLLAATVVQQVAAVVGPDAVTSVSVRGPSAPSWRAGPRVVKGRGPRDTYG